MPPSTGRSDGCARLACALLALVAASCGPLDRRTPFRSPAYNRGYAAMEAAAARATRGQGSLRAGWAAQVVAAPEGAPLAGYGERRGAPSTGIKDPCAVRALALEAGGERVLLFFADLLLVTPEVAAAVRARLATHIAGDAVLFTASHTHSGPGGYASGLVYELVFGAYDPRAFEAVVEAHVLAALAALADMAPARLGHAERRASGLIMNRVERGGPTDDVLLVVTVAREDGSRAVLWSFGCHAVTLPASNLQLSADYPGVVNAALAARGYSWSAYAAGGVGSSNPRYERPSSGWLTAPLIAAVSAAAERAQAQSAGDVSLSFARAEMPVAPLRYRVSRELMLWSELPRAAAGLQTTEMSALAVDRLLLLFVPGELSGELSRAARRLARQRGLTLGILPFDGSYVGYLVPRRVYELDPAQGEELFEYETQVMSFFGPYGADWMLNLALRLGQRTLGR